MTLLAFLFQCLTERALLCTLLSVGGAAMFYCLSRLDDGKRETPPAAPVLRSDAAASAVVISAQDQQSNFLGLDVPVNPELACQFYHNLRVLGISICQAASDVEKVPRSDFKRKNEKLRDALDQEIKQYWDIQEVICDFACKTELTSKIASLQETIIQLSREILQSCMMHKTAVEEKTKNRQELVQKKAEFRSYMLAQYKMYETLYKDNVTLKGTYQRAVESSVQLELERNELQNQMHKRQRLQQQMKQRAGHEGKQEHGIALKSDKTRNDTSGSKKGRIPILSGAGGRMAKTCQNYSLLT